MRAMQPIARRSSSAMARSVAPREESPADIERFVTDWQLQDELHPSAHFRFGGDGLDDEDPDDGGLGGEDFDASEDETVGEKEDDICPNEDHTADEAFDVLYVDMGNTVRLDVC